MARATDSAIDAVIASVEPLLIRHQYNRALERLTAHFEARMKIGGPTAARAVINAVWHITGDRRGNSDATHGALDDRRNKS